MNKKLSAYKKIIFIKLLGLYLIANFSLPLLEGIHFLLHLGDETEIHSYGSHNNFHTHTSLEIFRQFLNYEDSKHTSTTSKSIVKIKKNIQYFELETCFSFTPVLSKTKEFIFIENYKASPFLSLTAPPPKSKCLL